MTLKSGVTDDQLGRYYRKTTAIAERLGKSLPFDKVMVELQQIHDGFSVASHFERNEHGHIVLTLEGLNLTGEQEVERLLAAGFGVSEWAKSCLTSTKKDGYDKNHRLVAGQQYKIALVPTREIERDCERMADALRKRGIECCGYEKPPAGIVPRIRELVSDEQMREMGFWYIAAPHDSIADPHGRRSVLLANRNLSGRRLDASWGPPVTLFHDVGAFAFLVPAS